MSVYANLIGSIPYNPTAAAATGFLPPLMRAIGHILFATAAASSEPAYITEEEIERELQEAQNHLSSTNFPYTAFSLSAIATGHCERFVECVSLAAVSYTGWNAEERAYNLSTLADAAAGFAAYLDYELLGVAGSDPGTSL